jgi:hypothetical protein
MRPPSPTSLAIAVFAVATIVAVGRVDDWVSGAEDARQATPAVRFTEHLIADKYDYAYGVVPADLDGDGDIDLTSQNVVGGQINLSSMWWFENDGNGTFLRHLIHKDEDDIGWYERHTVGDINGDGRLDVAVVDNKFGRLVWFANNERPAAGQWQRFVITTKSPRVYDVTLADLDGDGDLDAADAGYANGQNCWYENPGPDGWSREWVRRVVGDKMPEARSIGAADFNGDGKIDLFAASVGAEKVPLEITDVDHHGSSIVWYENSGSPATEPWTKHVIDNTSRAPIHGHPMDLDGDGDIDVVMAHGMRAELLPENKHDVAWYENVGPNGKGTQWTRHTIGRLPFAFEAVGSDLDGDGDLDVVATAWAKGDRVVWFENPGNPRGPWTMHVVSADFKAANQVIVADLNGDGRPDVAATADSGSSRTPGAQALRWWRNESAPRSVSAVAAESQDLSTWTARPDGRNGTVLAAVNPDEGLPQVTVASVRRVFHNGEHNAFTDLCRFRGKLYLTFRSCPDGHMVHPTASIIVLRSTDGGEWEQVHRFRVEQRDTRDPHFLVFRDRLFVYTGTWFSGKTTLAREDYDLNKHLGYAAWSDDGTTWHSPIMLEGTFGHYIWRAASFGDKAYLCGRRKPEFEVVPRGEPRNVESIMLESDDGLVWRKRAVFQETVGDETAFLFELDGGIVGIGRHGEGKEAQLLRSRLPYTQWERKSLDRPIGGPLLTKWGSRYLVGGRKTTPNRGPKTSLCWLDGDRLIEFAELPSAGDNSYPGFVELSDSRALVSYYSSHERDDAGQPITAIYLATLSLQD